MFWLFPVAVAVEGLAVMVILTTPAVVLALEV